MKSSQNEYLLNIVALCVVLLIFSPLGTILQISSIAIYDGVDVQDANSTYNEIWKDILFISTYLPAIAYLVSLGAAIAGFIVDESNRKKAAITSFVAGGVMLVFGVLMFIDPVIPLVVLLFGFMILFFMVQNK